MPSHDVTHRSAIDPISQLKQFTLGLVKTHTWIFDILLNEVWRSVQDAPPHADFDRHKVLLSDCQIGFDAQSRPVRHADLPVGVNHQPFAALGFSQGL